MNAGGSSAFAGLRAALAENWRWLLLLSVAGLLSTKTLFNAPVLVMALAGLVAIVQRPREHARDPAVRLLVALFLCFWVPMLASLPGAADPGRSASTALEYLRFPLAGVFAFTALAGAGARRRFYAALLVLVLFWCADALWQLVHGTDFFGFPTHGARLSGAFYPKLTLGLVLAVLAPLCFEGMRRLARWRRGAWLLAVPLAVVVVMSGSRNGWLMLGLSTAGYAVYLFTGAGLRLRPGTVLLPLAVFALCAGAAVWQFPGVTTRVQATERLFNGDFEDSDAATAYRLSIWVPALRTIRGHWLNGVGPRGFRYVFAQYAGPANFWLQDGRTGVTHPHQFLLEVGADTGVIGLAGYALFCWMLLRSARRPPPGRRAPLVPALLAAAVAWFPLNSHMALFASYWSTVAWWLLLVYLADFRAALPGTGAAAGTRA